MKNIPARFLKNFPGAFDHSLPKNIKRFGQQ